MNTMEELNELKELLEKALELAKGGDPKGASKLIQEYTDRVIGKE